jgi:uncharacterized protein (TIGR03435 family)
MYIQKNTERIRKMLHCMKSSLRAIVSIALCLLPFGSLNGQTNTSPPQSQGAIAKTPSYEIIVVKKWKGDPNLGGIGDLPDGFFMTNLTLEPLITTAYGIEQNDQVTGWPGWARSIRFDITAKMDTETADALQKLPKAQREAQRQLMLQALLVDRFKLKVHHAAEVRTTYELVVAKGGPKMKEDNPATDMEGNKFQEGVRPSTDWMISDGKISGHAMTISILASHLQGGAVDGIVVDKTGLTRRYDVLLHWDATDGRNPNSTEPSIFTALQEQLGLRLQPTKTTVDTIVIDHLEMPSEN